MNKDETTIGDLMNEGRRFVLDVGEYHDGDGFRVIVVFEDHPGYFLTGEFSNRPDATPVMWWPTDDESKASEMAYKHSDRVLGLSKKQHRAIIMSSIGAQNKAKQVQVRRDPGTGEVWLRNGYDHEMQLDEEAAITLYQNLARSMELPFRESCTCGCLLNEEDKCESCDY